MTPRFVPSRPVSGAASMPPRIGRDVELADDLPVGVVAQLVAAVMRVAVRLCGDERAWRSASSSQLAAAPVGVLVGEAGERLRPRGRAGLEPASWMNSVIAWWLPMMSRAVSVTVWSICSIDSALLIASDAAASFWSCVARRRSDSACRWTCSRLAEQIDEHRHLRPQHLGHDRARGCSRPRRASTRARCASRRRTR